MKISANGRKLIQLYESLGDGDRTTRDFEPYTCLANIYTVGWGHVLLTPAGDAIDIDKYGAAVARLLASQAMMRKFRKPAITRAEADVLLDADVAPRQQYVERALAGSATTQGQFDALVSLAFNIGLGNFGTSTVKKLHNADKRQIGTLDIAALSDQARAKANPTTIPLAFARWSNVTGKYSLGLFRRRIAEVLVYTGWEAEKAFKLTQQFKG